MANRTVRRIHMVNIYYSYSWCQFWSELDAGQDWKAVARLPGMTDPKRQNRISKVSVTVNLAPVCQQRGLWKSESEIG